MSEAVVLAQNGYVFYDSREEDKKRIARENRMEREARMNGIQSQRPFNEFERQKLFDGDVAAGVVSGGKAAMEYRDEA